MEMHDIKTASDFWEKHAKFDPLWAIISDPAKKGRKWKAFDFFESGRGEISVLMYQLERFNIRFGRGKALDFGCGVGRVSQPLAAFFDRVVGIDISETMIRLADSLNRFPERVRYLSNQREDLRVLEDGEFDFIYSNIVLQHLPPELTLKYLEEFRRVLRPGGLMIFQLPSHHRKIESDAGNMVPMGDDFYLAEINLDDVPSSPQRPSAQIPLKVRVKNASGHHWNRTEAAPFRIGNHWLTARGMTLLIQDDGRADLPAHLGPGEECVVELIVKTPPEVGEYRCEIDVVHEMISWFKDKGSAAVWFDLEVRSDAPESFNHEARLAAGPPPVDEAVNEEWDDLSRNLPPEAEAKDPGEFPMFGIPREQIEDFFRSHGDSILLIENDDHGGWEWIGYRYVIRTRAR